MKANSENRYLNIFAGLLLTVVLFACGGGSNTGSASDEGTTQNFASILVVGDSISTGFNLATPWPNRLADMLNVSIDNSNSTDGVPTSFGLSYIDSELQRIEATHVILFLGTNDAIRGSATDAISNLQEMVGIANSQNVSVIVTTLPVITTSNSQNERAAEISDAIRSFTGVQVADIRAVLGDGSGVLADGIHPNNSGQQLIADTMAGFF